MADMMRGTGARPMPTSAAPRMPGIGIPGGGAGIPDRSSILNPNDMAKKLSTGDVRPGMTVQDLLAQIGVSPNDPIEKLTSALQGQTTNRTMMGKMAGAVPGAGAPNQPNRMPSMPGNVPQEQPGMSGLLNKIK